METRIPPNTMSIRGHHLDMKLTNGIFTTSNENRRQTPPNANRNAPGKAYTHRRRLYRKRLVKKRLTAHSTSPAGQSRMTEIPPGNADTTSHRTPTRKRYIPEKKTNALCLNASAT